MFIHFEKSILNVLKYLMTLTFDLLSILLQNFTFSNCMCSGRICVSCDIFRFEEYFVDYACDLIKVHKILILA